MRVPPRAVWIGSDHPFDLHEAYLDFRKDFELEAMPVRAVLTITADSRYKLWINGTYVARGPSRCWPDAQQVDHHDVAHLLKAGHNCIAVQVYSPGYSHFAYLHRGACGLLAWLEADGVERLATDTSWRVQRDLTWQPVVQRVSIYGSGVERQDLRRAADWLEADTSGEAWKAPRVMAPADGPIWSGLQQRDVPLLVEKAVACEHERAYFRRGSIGPLPDDPHEAVRLAVRGTKRQPAADGPVLLSAGETIIWCIDLGRSQVGLARAALTGARGGERLLVSYAEKLREGDVLISDPQTYCRMRLTDEFILRAGPQTVEPFSQRGGRYVIFCLTASEAVTLSLEFSFLASSYPVAAKPVAGADNRLQQIADLCWRSLQSCLQDGFVDSVWRESSMWLGDCVTAAFALAAVSNDAQPLRRAITMAAHGAYADGVLPSVLPGEVHAYTVVDYNFSWVELLRMYNAHPGASDAIELTAAMWPVLASMLERFDRDRGDNGLLVSQPGRRLFLDWSPLDRREPNLTYNARYLHALMLASELARITGDEHSQKIWTARADRQRKAITTALRPAGRWQENTFGTQASQLGLSLALLTGCVDEAEALPICQSVIARSLDLDDTHSAAKLVLASPFMHHYIFLALEKFGHLGPIFDIIRARWGRWAAAGEATTWENWNVDFPDGSVCHAFSAHPLGWIARCQAASSR